MPLSVEERRGGYRLRNADKIVIALDKIEIVEVSKICNNIIRPGRDLIS